MGKISAAALYRYPRTHKSKAQHCSKLSCHPTSSLFIISRTVINPFIANFHNNMRQALLDAYSDVVREGLTFKEASTGGRQRHCSAEASSRENSKGGSLIDFD